ncbi:MAG TPA: DUF6134 family protein [Geminicoccaceae bacterium]
MSAFPHMSRRRLLGLTASAAAMPLLGPLTSARAHAAARRDLRFRALWRGSAIGEHRVAFRMDGDRLVVDTHVDIAVRVLFFTVFRLKHDAQEIWQAGRLVSVTSTTNRDGTRLQVSGNAAADGFRIVGEDGPFLAAAELLTTNALWDSRIVHEQRLIDVQYGGEIGLVAKLLGDERVDTPQGPVRASRYQMITPHYAGSVFYDRDQRWVKALIEMKGQTIDYALAT